MVDVILKLNAKAKEERDKKKTVFNLEIYKINKKKLEKRQKSTIFTIIY